MPHQLRAAHLRADNFLPGLQKREVLRGWNTAGNYRKVRSHVKLVFTSACSARRRPALQHVRTQAAFRLRRGPFCGSR